MFKETLLKELNIFVDEKQLQAFEDYFHLLVETNEKMNLTAITEKQEVYIKHFYDSLTIIDQIPKGAHILDMGSGAGFPSIPIKILRSDVKVTIVDALNKRIRFLEKLTKKLRLMDVFLYHDRAEKFALMHQKKFDVVTARAFGVLPLILELGIPTLKEKGLFLAMKGQNYKEELENAQSTLKVLCAKIDGIKELTLPNDYGDRAIITIIKEKHINGYPRDYQKILKKPL